MACKINCDAVLKGKNASYKVEVDAYLESLDIATSTEISAQKIFYAICDSPVVDSNLKAMYREYLFGSNKDVRSHIKNRISNFRRRLR